MTRNPDVDAWFGAFERPAKDAMLAARDLMLADGQMSETIKWKSLTPAGTGTSP